MPNISASRRPREESLKGRKLFDVLKDLDKSTELAWISKNVIPKQDIWQGFGPMVVWFVWIKEFYFIFC